MSNIFEYFCINKIDNNRIDEKVIYRDIDRDIFISNFGRIFYKKEIDTNILEKVKSYRKDEFTLIQDGITLSESELINLLRYLKYADEFMLFLINEKYKNFDMALKEYINENNIIELTYGEKRSLLKPTFYRYSKKSFDELRNIKIQIQKRRKYLKEEKYQEYIKGIPKNISLYNIPCNIYDSNLKILGKFEIDLSENIMLEKYNCDLIGIKEFDRIDIELGFVDKSVVLNLKATYKGEIYEYNK